MYIYIYIYIYIVLYIILHTQTYTAAGRTPGPSAPREEAPLPPAASLQPKILKSLTI